MLRHNTPLAFVECPRLLSSATRWLYVSQVQAQSGHSRAVEAGKRSSRMPCRGCPAQHLRATCPAPHRCDVTSFSQVSQAEPARPIPGKAEHTLEHLELRGRTISANLLAPSLSQPSCRSWRAAADRYAFTGRPRRKQTGMLMRPTYWAELQDGMERYVFTSFHWQHPVLLARFALMRALYSASSLFRGCHRLLRTDSLHS